MDERSLVPCGIRLHGIVRARVFRTRRGLSCYWFWFLRRYTIFCNMCTTHQRESFDWPLADNQMAGNNSPALRPSCSPCSGSLSYASQNPRGRSRPTPRRLYSLSQKDPPSFRSDGRGTRSKRSSIVPSSTLPSGPHRSTENTTIRPKSSSAR